MKTATPEELAAILCGKLDFVLELYVLTEHTLCKKPVYKFAGAFTGDAAVPEFCLVYCEADDPDEIFVSINSNTPNIFEEATLKYNPRKIIYHGENGGCESYYRVGGNKNYSPAGNIRLLTRDDKITADDYFGVIFHDFMERQIYRDCGIAAVTDAGNNFAGYLAYYEIAENIRDVSYIYVAEHNRGKGYGKALLEFFAQKNAAEEKISYYSYADGEASAALAKSCGFLPCAKRTEERKNELYGTNT